jgi:hypothetical protein
MFAFSLLVSVCPFNIAMALPTIKYSPQRGQATRTRSETTVFTNSICSLQNRQGLTLAPKYHVYTYNDCHEPLGKYGKLEKTDSLSPVGSMALLLP